MVDGFKLNKNITLQQNHGSLKISIPINRNHFYTTIHLIVLVLWVLIGGVNLYTSAATNHILFSIVFTTAWFLVSVFLAERCLLLFNSFEEIIIESGLLSVQRTGALFKRRKSFIIEDIASFWIYNFNENVFQREHPIKGERPLRDGIIKFNYKLSEQSIGIGLSEEEAVEILNILVLKNFITDQQWQYVRPFDRQ